ncbi:MAG: hypothetical protein ACD_20C00155G0007 [uncultured bacterium]|nr:MAG: hypothetical protein ACD_20C00155G0007 [uncultured bacterium]HBH18188.1 hypothetical protein [Cyanobacteria bacterium UBA9579]
MIENGLEFYKDIFENILEGILLCSSDFIIIDVNKSFEELSG